MSTVCEHLDAVAEYPSADVTVTHSTVCLCDPDAASIENSPGDTSIDEIVVSIGLSGTTFLVLTGDGGFGPHELTYGLVFDTVGCGTVNFHGMTSLVVPSSCYLPGEEVVVCEAESVADVVTIVGASMFDSGGVVCIYEVIVVACDVSGGLEISVVRTWCFGVVFLGLRGVWYLAC